MPSFQSKVPSPRKQYKMADNISEPDADLPDRLGDDDCPVCYGERALVGRTAVCPNGHRLCAECQPHVQGVRNFRTGMASCPLCRADIPHVPRQAQPARMNEEQLENHRAGLLERWADEAAAGRAADRRERAIRGFQQNGQTRRAGREQFLQHREHGHIPGDALYGGVHDRKCGNRNCERRGGTGGVRFLKTNHGKRVYRCEACYRDMTGFEPAPAPAFTQFQHE
jgi:hypothetical protein